MFDKKNKTKKKKNKNKTNTKKCLSIWGAPPPPESSASNSDGVPMGDQLTSQSMNALNAKGGPNKSIAFRNSDIFPTFSV